MIALFFLLFLTCQAQAGMDFTKLSGDAAMTLPRFESTNEAVMWAHQHRGNEALIKQTQNYMSNLTISVGINLNANAKKEALKAMEKWYRYKMVLEILTDKAMGASCYVGSEAIK